MQKDLLRFSIIGNVDDGKSTLLGRLLFDTKSLTADQIEHIESSSKRRGDNYLNLALLTDGLKAEREQGITIDVAYRYFNTNKRKFIIADCPGHEEYTRNMITGTSTAQLSVIMVDARVGMTSQTKRHAFIASMMGVKHLIVCINKMDLVNFEETTFEKVTSDVRDFLSRVDIYDVEFIPVCALEGDNIATKSPRMNWYQGATLLYELENAFVSSDANFKDPRFSVQRVIRPMNPLNQEFHDFRGFAGKIESGVYRVGDEVMLLPSQQKTKIKEIFQASKKIDTAFYPMSVMMTLTDECDLSRGDMIVRENNVPQNSKNLDLLICWFDKSAIDKNKKYQLQHQKKSYPTKIEEILYSMDIETLHRKTDHKNLAMNDIGRVKIKTNKDIYFDQYRQNRSTGSIILTDDTGNTVAAGIIW